MKTIKEVVPRAIAFFLMMTLLCGGLYTLVVTGAGQLLFHDKANGSIVEVDGKKYGSAALAQQFTDTGHLWGRIMNIDTETFTDEDGNPVMYAWASNLSPASEEYKELIAERVLKIQEAHPDKAGVPIPEDLVTCSGSGLDPHISVAAAEYQIQRIARNTGRSVDEVQAIIDRYTTGRFLGIFGEPTVNVLKVNLALDGILTE